MKSQKFKNSHKRKKAKGVLHDDEQVFANFRKKFCTEKFFINIPGGRFEITNNFNLKEVA